MTQNNEAELEKYYEQDMIEFLDKKATGAEKQTEITQIEEALKEKNTKKANEILKEIIERYNRTSKNDVYKEIYFNRIIGIVKKIKTYLQKNEEPSELRNNIDLIEKSQELKSGIIDNITVFEEQEKEKEKEKKQRLQEEENLANELSKQMKNINKHIFIAIRKQDLKKAMIYYREFKKRFEQYPTRFIEDKKELYNDLLALFMNIKKLKKQLIKNKEQKNKTKEKSRKKLKIEDVKEQIQQIQTQIQNQEYKKAKMNILDLKHKISLIPNQYKNIKQSLEDITKSLIKKIEFSKKINQEPKKEEDPNESKKSN